VGLYALGVGRGYGGYGYGNYGYSNYAGNYAGGNYPGAYSNNTGQPASAESPQAAQQVPADQDYVPQLNDAIVELVAGASGGAVLGITMDPQYPQAAVVRTVTPGSPADRGGLRPGDMITTIDQKQVQSYNDVVSLIGGMQPGTRVALQYVRPILRSEVKAAAPEPQPAQQPTAESAVVQPSAPATTANPPAPPTPTAAPQTAR
jgi:predicted metalloprotease with PDZ domain